MERAFTLYPDFRIDIYYEDIDGKKNHYWTKKHIYAHDFTIIDIGN